MKHTCLGFIMFLTMLFISPDISHSFELEGWYHREIGYQSGLKEAKNNNLPLVIFFYSDSNELSQLLEDSYLTSYEMYYFLNNIPRVDIDLNGDEFEKEIAAQYKVDTEPALLVAFPFYETDPKKLSPFLSDRDMNPQEFTENLKNIIVLEYNNIAYDCFEKEEYEKAVVYYTRSVNYDPERAYTYFGLGSAYHAMAIKEKNRDLFKKSIESYKKALELNPDFFECNEEMARLEENMKKMGME